LKVAALAALAMTTRLEAQGIYVGLRGGAGIPTGTFSDNSGTVGQTTLDAAKTGFGYGLDAGISLGLIGIYAGFDHINFDCESSNCNTDNKYKLQGVAAGVRLNLPGTSMIRPWVKGGVTFNELEGAVGSTEFTTERNPGYEIAGGLDIPILGILSIYPQARYVGQNFKPKIPGVTTPTTATEQGANFFAFDLGFSVHTPFGGKH
jgi:hypothetical protein